MSQAADALMGIFGFRRVDHFRDATEMVWQPIETAPKDWPIWLGRPYRMRIGLWFEDEQHEKRGSKGGEWFDLETNRKIDFVPTHWMPLPEPPK